MGRSTFQQAIGGARTSLRPLWVLAGASLCLYVVLAYLSRSFDVPSQPIERPILAVIGLLAALFALYGWALWLALGLAETRQLLWCVLLTSFGFRLAMVGSLPIQEIDIYRYLWDGAVTEAGLSPYHYSPAEIRSTSAQLAPTEELRQLARLRDCDPELAIALERIHFAELPSIYPPVSQLVFAVGRSLTPAGSTVYVQLVVLKLLLVALDLTTLGLVMAMLRLAKLHAAWAIAYGWCPLLLKEVAGSGHLDAIAVCCSAAAIYVAARSCGPWQSPSPRSVWWQTMLAALLLALATGAKLYPVILAPLWLVTLYRHRGLRIATAALLVTAAATLLLLLPMVTGSQPPETPAATDTMPTEQIQRLTARDSLHIFLSQWMMNDFLFQVLVENLKPEAAYPDGARPWFVVLPDGWRHRWTTAVSNCCNVSIVQAAFYIARAVTLLVFFCLASRFVLHAAAAESVGVWFRQVFLTIAWFWLLTPTCNPWYWTWALPWVCFARCRSWLFVSGLVSIYYLRFWLEYHWGDLQVLGTSYTGPVFYDYVVTWLEFGPWLMVLAGESCWRNYREQRLDEERIPSHRLSRGVSQK